jgi:hypothetical protein
MMLEYEAVLIRREQRRATGMSAQDFRISWMNWRLC